VLSQQATVPPASVSIRSQCGSTVRAWPKPNLADKKQTNARSPFGSAARSVCHSVRRVISCKTCPHKLQNKASSFLL